MTERFIVDDATEMCANERKFQNGKCVQNTRLGFAYSVDEIVEVLNDHSRATDYFWDLLQIKIWYMQGMYKKTGDEIFMIIENQLRILRDEMHEVHAIDRYGKELIKLHEEDCDIDVIKQRFWNNFVKNNKNK